MLCLLWPGRHGQERTDTARLKAILATERTILQRSIMPVRHKTKGRACIWQARPQHYSCTPLGQDATGAHGHHHAMATHDPWSSAQRSKGHDYSDICRNPMAFTSRGRLLACKPATQSLRDTRPTVERTTRHGVRDTTKHSQADSQKRTPCVRTLTPSCDCDTRPTVERTTKQRQWPSRHLAQP